MSDKNNQGSYAPFVPASANVAELTVKSVALGLILAVILCAANAYLGLYAGMTVSAAIPAAVISMAILRGLLRTGTILENTIVQTTASSGEALAAGAIFTIPALLISGVWTEIKFWPTVLICIAGGILGIIFMIPLRRSHIVEEKDLTYPEGVACAEVLKAGEKGGIGAKFLGIALLIGLVFKFFTSGLSVMKASVERAFFTGKTGFFFGCDISPALLGIGYIIGTNIAAIVFLGGMITWLIVIPFYGNVGLIQGDLQTWFWDVWATKARFVGVGAMIVGGVWSIYTIRSSIAKGLREAILGYRSQEANKEVARTDRNMARNHVMLLLGMVVVIMLGLYYYLLKHVGITLIATISMVVMSFFFAAVASYIVGMIGSSNSPVSGMTICAVLVTGLALWIFGMKGMPAIFATLGVAGVVCSAAATAGDISQDLKTGYLVGATPKWQQWVQVIGHIVPAFIIAPVLVVLHNSYGIGTSSPTALKAPQATLFASIANGLFGAGNIPLYFVGFGMAAGILIILIDLTLKSQNSKFRLPVMAVAVGMYLPWNLGFPILLGGLVSAAVKNKSDTDTGILFSSGLIAGEAVCGVLLATAIYFNKTLFPREILSSNLLSLAGLLALAGLLYYVAKKGAKQPA